MINKTGKARATCRTEILVEVLGLYVLNYVSTSPSSPSSDKTLTYKTIHLKSIPYFNI